MTKEEITKTVRQMIDSLESIHEKILAYGQESLEATDQTHAISSFHNGGSAKERAAYDIFTER